MKILKAFFSLLAIVVVLLTIAVATLPQWVDPNDYKEELSRAVKEHTGLTLSIQGDLSLSLFPWIGVNTGHVVLSQPESIVQSTPNAGAFIDVQAIDIKVKLKPLLSRRVEVDTILLKQPRIELITDAAGNSSIDSLTSTETASDAPQGTPKDTPSNTQALAGFTIAGLDISKGHIIIDDKLNNAHHEIKDVNINSGDILSGNKAPLSISGIISTADLPPITVDLKSQISLDQDNIRITLNNFAASVTQEANTLSASIDQITYSHPSASADITNSQFSGSANGLAFALTIPEVMLDNNKAMLHIPKITANGLGVDVSGKLRIKNWNSTVMAVGHIESAPFNAKKVLQTLNIDYTPTAPKALEKVSFASSFTATPKGLSLQKTTFGLDQTTLEGSVAIVNFEKPQYRFDLSVNSIVIDDYLPLEDKSAQTEQASENISAGEALAAPIALLKDIYANGVFRAKKITASNIVLENNVITVASTNNTVTIKPVLDLYQGHLKGTIKLTRSKNPTLSLVTQLQNVNLEPLLTSADITDQFSGIGNLSTNLVVSDTNGKPSSKGTIKISTKDGEIKGVDIKKILDDAQATIDKLRGKAVSPSNASEDATRFAEMRATLLLDNDIITNNDLSIKAPAFRIKGDGTVNIDKQTLDYLTSIVVVNTNAGQGGASSDSLKGITLPVRFTGSLTEPSYKIDTRALIKANTAQRVDEEKDKLKDKLLKKLGIDKAASNDETGAAQEAPQSAGDALKDKLKKRLFDKLF